MHRSQSVQQPARGQPTGSFSISQRVTVIYQLSAAIRQQQQQQIQPKKCERLHLWLQQMLSRQQSPLQVAGHASTLLVNNQLNHHNQPRKRNKTTSYLYPELDPLATPSVKNQANGQWNVLKSIQSRWSSRGTRRRPVRAISVILHILSEGPHSAVFADPEPASRTSLVTLAKQ